MKVVYIADDGMEFDDEFECRDYEWKLIHSHLKTVRFFDENDMELENIFLEETYWHTEKIIVPTDEAAKDLQELAGYTGYCSYGDITEAGIWIYDNDNSHFVLKEKFR